MMNKIIVVLSAKKMCGKSTIADFLANEYGYKKIAIADVIKEECSEILGIPIENFYDQKVKELYFETPFGLTSPRKFMQWWGMYKREYSSTYYWLDSLKEKIENSDSNYIVVEDVRLKFEAEYIRNAFFNSLMVRIEPYEGWNYWDDHITEIDMDTYRKFDLELKPEFGELKAVAGTINQNIKDTFEI